MKKKNFRTLKIPPVARTETTIRCAACGLTMKLNGSLDERHAELSRLHWYLINNQLCFCPNCDVIVVQ